MPFELFIITTTSTSILPKIAIAIPLRALPFRCCSIVKAILIYESNKVTLQKKIYLEYLQLTTGSTFFSKKKWKEMF